MMIFNTASSYIYNLNLRSRILQRRRLFTEAGLTIRPSCFGHYSGATGRRHRFIMDEETSHWER